MLKIIELISKGINIIVILHFLFYLIPFMLSYSLPISILSAVLLCFSKLSAENEITTIRASGINLWHIFIPIMAVALVLITISSVLNDKVRPNALFQGRELLFKAGIEEPIIYIEQGRFTEIMPDYMIYVGQKNNKKLRKVIVYQFDKNKLCKVTTAEKGIISYKKNTHTVSLKLFNGSIMEISGKGKGEEGMNNVQFNTYNVSFNINTKPYKISNLKKREREMTNTELRAKIQYLKKKNILANTKWINKGISEDISSILTRIQTRIALSFSSFVFILIGFPLGVRIHRKETSIGIAISLMFVAGYYFLMTFIEAFQDKAELCPWLLIWIPNTVLALAGVLLIYKLFKK